MISRRRTRQVRVGGLKVGGGAPVSIQSMTKTKTSDVARTIREINVLEEAGCEIVRVAVRDASDAESIKKIKHRIRIPLVADIHFHHRLALKAIENGADKIRINPGNISKPDELSRIVKAAKARRIPIRIGLNSGSLPREGRESTVHSSQSTRFVSYALRYIKTFEEMDFRDIIISLKASDVVSTVEAYRGLAKACDYPFHLGVTASGLSKGGTIKSAIGIGALLLDGIGDTIRVSLTSSSLEEVSAARHILSALGLRKFGPEIIACPTCGRCGVNLVDIVKEFEARVTPKDPAVKVAIMGCEVNGPGEARDARIGIAAGKGCGVIFRNGKILRKVREKDFVKELLKELRR